MDGYVAQAVELLLQVWSPESHQKMKISNQHSIFNVSELKRLLLTRFYAFSNFKYTKEKIQMHLKN
jgi:hypothetical protein